MYTWAGPGGGQGPKYPGVPDSVAPSTPTLTPSARSVWLAGMFHTVQCNQAPLVASGWGSSIIMAKVWVFCGAPVNLKFGLTSPPSQVYFFGIEPLFINALLVNLKISDVGEVGRVGKEEDVAVGSEEEGGEEIGGT